MTYTKPWKPCEVIDNSNEGILLSAALPNFTDNIHFYYRRTKSQNKQYPRVNFTSSEHEVLQLHYQNGDNFIVPGTLDASDGLLNYTVDMSRFMNQFVSLTWKQEVYIKVSRGPDCDVWSLDNVEVTLQYKNCTKTVLSENFEDIQ